jgi:hypothetical protein
MSPECFCGKKHAPVEELSVKEFTQLHEQELRTDGTWTREYDKYLDLPPEPFVGSVEEWMKLHLDPNAYRGFMDRVAQARIEDQVWGMVIGGLVVAAFAFDRWWLWILTGVALFMTLVVMRYSLQRMY